jgi:hypothetical protein
VSKSLRLLSNLTFTIPATVRGHSRKRRLVVVGTTSLLLAAELIDHIFSFLRGNILAALTACSKANPFYSRLAERHLYPHIVVNFGRLQTTFREFTYPGLPPHLGVVRKFSIRGSINHQPHTFWSCRPQKYQKKLIMSNCMDEGTYLELGISTLSFNGYDTGLLV